MCTAESRMVAWSPVTSVDGGDPHLFSLRINRKSIKWKPRLSCPIGHPTATQFDIVCCYVALLENIRAVLLFFSYAKYTVFNTIATRQKITKMAAHFGDQVFAAVIGQWKMGRGLLDRCILRNWLYFYPDRLFVIRNACLILLDWSLH